MTGNPRLDAIGIVVQEMARAIEFYQLCGLDFSDDDEGHVEAKLRSGLRIMLDTEDVVRSFDESLR